MKTYDQKTLKLKIRRYLTHVQFEKKNDQVIFWKKSSKQQLSMHQKIRDIVYYVKIGGPALLGALILLMYSTEFLTTNEQLTQTTVGLLFYYALLNVLSLKRRPVNKKQLFHN